MSVGETLFNLTTCLEAELVVKFQKPEVSNAAADISNMQAEIEPNDDGMWGSVRMLRQICPRPNASSARSSVVPPAWLC